MADERKTETRLAWAAGFLDGDGCFALRKVEETKRNPIVRGVAITAANNSLAPLEELADLLGGKVRYSTTTTAGNAHYHWGVTKAVDVKAVCDALFPHLIEKKEQAAIISRFAASMRRRGQSGFSEEEIAMRTDLIERFEVERNG